MIPKGFRGEKGREGPPGPDGKPVSANLIYKKKKRGVIFIPAVSDFWWYLLFEYDKIELFCYQGKEGPPGKLGPPGPRGLKVRVSSIGILIN